MNNNNKLVFKNTFTYLLKVVYDLFNLYLSGEVPYFSDHESLFSYLGWSYYLYSAATCMLNLEVGLGSKIVIPQLG